MNHFKIITRAEVHALTSKRDGETKLGETVQCLDTTDWQDSLKASTASFVLLGIPEDIGVRANYGVGGTQSLWQPALKAILNVQDTTLLQGSQMAVLGAFDFAEMMEQSKGKRVEDLRELVNHIDDAVYPVIKAIADAGKIPVVIGGGHNNAYPILKGVSRSKSKAINCINLDAHSDYRSVEGRHSGNGFRYAKMEGYLRRYAVVGLHRNYNSQNMIDEMASDPDIHLSFYEDVFIEEKNSFKNVLDNAIRFTAGTPVGVEIDLDCIERTLSSAATPCGISSLQARQFLFYAARFTEAAYLHLPEGCIRLEDGREDRMTAKLVSYLVTDFMRNCSNRQTTFIQ
jgi:formiminoglutamase